MNPLREKRAKALAEAFADPDHPTPVAMTPVPKIDGTVATIRLYDAIDSWGGWWGISAKEFTAALDALPEDTSEIRILINSPGGEVTEGIAIINALRSHKAKTVAVVEGIAASCASVIAAGCDETVMMRGSEMFIHNAWVLTWGDAEDLRGTADTLENHFDRNIAEVYADKSGNTVAHWLAEMAKDLWLNADDAVAAGLADRVDGKPSDAAAKARADFGESLFARASRPAASLAAPKPPSSTEPVDTNRKESVVPKDTDDFKAGLIERLGMTDAAASDDAILAAVDEVLEKATEPAPAASTTVPEGTTLIDSEVLADLQSKAEAGVKALAAQTKARHEGILASALAEGRIAPASKDTWAASLEENEERAKSLLDGLPKNAIPVTEIGAGDGPDASPEDALYNRLYPKGA